MPELFSNYGHCPTCNQPTRFVAVDPWLRDGYVCERCHSIPRERALMWAIERFYPDWRERAIHEASPSGRGASVRLQQECARYASSHYFAGVPSGALVAGVECQDLEDLSLDDESVDIFVTQDVMEHVLDPARAFRGIARVVRPGGAHVFTTPLVRGHRASLVRARRDPSGTVTLLATPEYHGNPIADGRSLVTMHYGYDICKIIFDACGLFTVIVSVDAIDQGIKGELNEVLVTWRLP